MGGVGGGGFHLAFALVYQRADDIALLAPIQRRTQKAKDPGVVGGGDHIGADLLPPGGQLVQYGYVQIAVDHHGQGAGNGRGAHDQGVHFFTFHGQIRSLLHPKAVLLIGDYQPQVGEFYIILDQRVGAYRNVYIALQQICLHLSLLLGGAGAGEQA